MVHPCCRLQKKMIHSSSMRQKSIFSFFRNAFSEMDVQKKNKISIRCARLTHHTIMKDKNDFILRLALIFHKR